MGVLNLVQKSFVFGEFFFRYRHYAIVLIQIIFVLVGYGLAFLLRFDFQIPEEFVPVFLKTLPILFVCRLSTYYLFKLNSGWWRYVSMIDLINITKAIVLGAIIFVMLLVFTGMMVGFPRSVVIMEALLNFVLLGGTRFGVRWFRETHPHARPKQMRYVLIFGAGKAGAQLLNEIRINSHLGLRVVGFIDDDLQKRNAYIQGVKIVGTSEDIPYLVKHLDVDEIIISIPSAGHSKISSFLDICKDCGVKTKVLPSLAELINQDGLWQQLREVPYDELLGRPLLNFRRADDLELLKREIKHKTVLITGAGGSIGTELARQVAKRKPKILILYERNETSLYFLEIELRKMFPKCNILPIIGDILNREKLNDVLSEHKVNLIYHAAAYKHVPMMEREPLEAVRNNVTATKTLVECALANQVDKCVYVSTDKAVNPCNIMGATKRVGEMVMQAYVGKATKLIIVRFGNVIGSNGSVVPLFKKQIARGGPVTVTHPEATRYFMAISEAVQLVMTAGSLGKGGEIFLLDMGNPIRIEDLAKKLIASMGLVSGKDVEIEYIGLRPGEKLHEELYWQGEDIVPTSNKKITMLKTNGFDREAFLSQLRRLKICEHNRNHQALFEVLQDVVKEAVLSSNDIQTVEEKTTMQSTVIPSMTT